MVICFLDSSALVKRYIVETGSAWIKSQTDPASGNQLYVAWITCAEDFPCPERQGFRRASPRLRGRRIGTPSDKTALCPRRRGVALLKHGGSAPWNEFSDTL